MEAIHCAVLVRHLCTNVRTENFLILTKITNIITKFGGDAVKNQISLLFWMLLLWFGFRIVLSSTDYFHNSSFPNVITKCHVNFWF